ncbi:hypothetical protein EH165_04830 [Nakamurella antarctica]|uniref:Tetratricopeptide repeat protein n=1 Tax=Nakamurella antarctica TaxID=1902245 RepID=A0A3G8ZJP8_9ACTN|nr:hypothetical protein [Nakamurella antarctica]AZI57582.1 hypothetical protein EH165_04830 [Nakamurella antarctica]
MRDLRGLSKEGAEFVAVHMVAATGLSEEDPELAWRHARAARSKGGRIAVVRETVGLVAYRAGEWAEAISELRAARRMGGGPGHVAILADCERAQGNPERALELARSDEALQLDAEGAAELRIVVAGARADMGQLDAALAHLHQGSGFDLAKPESFSARLYYAYADLLIEAERNEEALEWFIRANDADFDEETDAPDRIAELLEAREEADAALAAMGGADSGPALPDVRETGAAVAGSAGREGKSSTPDEESAGEESAVVDDFHQDSSNGDNSDADPAISNDIHQEATDHAAPSHIVNAAEREHPAVAGSDATLSIPLFSDAPGSYGATAAGDSTVAE